MYAKMGGDINGARSPDADRTLAWPPASLVGRLRPTVRAELLRLGADRRYPAGQALVREGDRTTHAVLLTAGHVKVFASTEQGGSTLLAIRPRGDLVGELAAISDAPRSATVVAPIPVSGREIDRAALLAFLGRHPDAALALAGMEGDRLRMANRRRLDINGYDTRRRLARLLVELSASFGRDTPRGRMLDLTLTQPEFAQLIGAADITVQRAFRALRQAGLVATGYRSITVLQPAALAALVGYD